MSVGQFADNGIKSTFLKTTVELSLINTGLLNLQMEHEKKATGIYALPSSTVPKNISGAVTDHIGATLRCSIGALPILNAKDLSNLYMHTDGVLKLG